MKGMPLKEYLTANLADGDEVRTGVAALVDRFAGVAAELRLAINEGALGAAFGATLASNNADGDDQKALDVHADHLFINAARRPVLPITPRRNRPIL